MSTQSRLPLDEIASPNGSVVPPPPDSRIYCNRSLRLDRIAAVGFDMDYTLAIYRQDEIDRLSIEVTVDKLVKLGYPEGLRAMTMRTDFPVRGLLVDTKLGNVVKMDRYRYVTAAFHGTQRLLREQRRAAYTSKQLRPGTSRYHWVDTLYGLSEVAIYVAAIDLFEARNESVDYSKLFTDIRASADASHQDGSILDVVASDLPRFVERDPELGNTLHKLRSSGKKLFLLTNSWSKYSDLMMSYLLDGAREEYGSWRGYFDYIVTAARKPRFFVHRDPFIDEATGEPAKTLTRGRVYRHGNLRDLERALGVVGDEILYVGDHIYGDVLRAKKTSAWRTAMIIQELDEELRVLLERRSDFAWLNTLDAQFDASQDELRERQTKLKLLEKQIAEFGDTWATSTRAEHEMKRTRYRHRIDHVRARLKSIEAERKPIAKELILAFHPYWGSLMRSGRETSSFGAQVQDYACLYTTRASNLSRYSPVHYFETPRDLMPHER